MRRIHSYKTLWLCLFLSIYILPIFASGGDDHTHGEEIPSSVSVGKSYFSTEAVSDKYEMLLRYEPIKPNSKAILRLFISEYATNKPIEKADLKITAQEDGKIVFTVVKSGEGVYTVEAIFPEERKYSLAVSINTEKGADLILLSNVNVGKLLPHLVDDESKSMFANWQTIILILITLIAGLGIGMLIQRRNTSRGRSTIAVFLILVQCLLPIAAVDAEEGHAHGPNGEHLDTKAQSVNFSNTFEVPKETQFLFNVYTDKIYAGSFTESIKLFGTIVPGSQGQAQVSTPQSGKIISLMVQVGQTIKKGQQLAIIEQTIDGAAQVNMMAERNNLLAEYEAAKKDFDRMNVIQDIAAKKDIDEATARLQKAESNLKLFNSQSGKRIELNAPIDGILSNFNLTTGSTVNAGQTLFTITNLLHIYAEAQVFDKDAMKVKEGVKFTIECANDNHKTSEVKLISKAQEINSTNQSQRVLFELDNPDSDFKIGEFVNIRVFDSENSKQIALPNSAITEINGKPVVFIKDAAERYSISYVQTAENNGSYTAILKGVKEGERVVINAAYQLKMIYLNQ